MTEIQLDVLQLKATIETLRTSIESKDQELGQYQMTVVDLETKWTKSMADHSEYMKRLEVLRTDQKTLTASLEEAQKTLGRERQTHARARGDWTAQLELAQETSQALNDTQSQMVQHHLEKEQTWLEMLEKTKNEFDESQFQLKQTRVELKNTNLETQEYQSTLQTELQQTKAELKVQLEAVTVLLEHNTNLKHVHETSSVKSERFKEQLEAKTLTCDDLADALEVSESAFHESKCAYDDLCHHHEALTRQVQSTCAHSKHLELELEQLGREKKTLEEKCGIYTQELEALVREHATLGAKFEEHERTLREKTQELKLAQERAVVQDLKWQEKVVSLEKQWEDQKKELEKGLDILRRKETMLREWKSYQHRLPVRRQVLPVHHHHHSTPKEENLTVAPVRPTAPPVVVNLSMLRELRFQNESLRQTLCRDAEEMEALDQHVKAMASEYENHIVKRYPR